MRKTNAGILLLVLLCLPAITGCLGKLHKIDAEIDTIEAQIADLEKKKADGTLTPGEVIQLESLHAQREEAYERREEEVKKIEAAGGIASTLLILLGTVFGVPLLVATGNSVAAATKPRERKKGP